MAFDIPKETYKGAVNEVVMGNGPGAVNIGGENAPAFHAFEGQWPNPPRFALEVHDIEPTEWADTLTDAFAGVLGDPPAWARRCIDSYGADAILLQLTGTDPIEKDTSPQEAAELTKQVADAVNVPLIVYGTGAEDKDADVLIAVAERCAGLELFLGPLLKKNFERIGEAAREFGHGVVIQTALEIPEAKELNQKLTKTFPGDRILYDPISPGLGYGMEYGYSVIERMKLAATSFGDPNLGMPLLANVGRECWDTKEAKETREQGLMWEAMTGLTYILAGANVLTLRHPATMKTLREIIGLK